MLPSATTDYATSASASTTPPPPTTAVQKSNTPTSEMPNEGTTTALTQATPKVGLDTFESEPSVIASQKEDPFSGKTFS